VALRTFPRLKPVFAKLFGSRPEEPYPHYELGYTLALVGRYEESVEELNQTQQLRRAFFTVETEIWMCEQVVSGSVDAPVLELLRSQQRLVDAGEEQGADAVALGRQVTEEAPECALAPLPLRQGDVPARSRGCRGSAPPLHRAEAGRYNDHQREGSSSVLCQQDGRDGEARSIREGILAEYPEHAQTVFVTLA
jgi:hypothetical protein